MTSPVSWQTASRVGAFVGSGRMRIGPARPPVPLNADERAELDADFAEATERAEGLVVAATGLHPPSGPPRGQVVDRAAWVAQNLKNFERLLSPILERLGADTQRLPGPLATATGRATGVQLGVILGWMSTRVLGQYDLLLTEDPDDDGDVVSYVGPNVVELERRNGFPPKQFRQWIALHEVTHRCQFTGVPWLRSHFLSLVNEGLGAMPTDTARLAESLKRAVAEIRAGRNPLEESGIVGLVAPPEQLAVIGRIQALMSLLEGHGDVTMDRAGVGVVAEAQWFARVLRERRRKASPAARLMQQLIGMEAKLRQYQQGEQFIAAVEAAGGPELLSEVWVAPERLPTMEEIRQPSLWIERMGAPRLAAS